MRESRGNRLCRGNSMCRGREPKNTSTCWNIQLHRLVWTKHRNVGGGAEGRRLARAAGSRAGPVKGF